MFCLSVSFEKDHHVSTTRAGPGCMYYDTERNAIGATKIGLIKATGLADYFKPGTWHTNCYTKLYGVFFRIFNSFALL